MGGELGLVWERGVVRLELVKLGLVREKLIGGELQGLQE